MKKLVTLLIIAALAAALCVSLVACNNNDSKGSFGGNGGFGNMDTAEEIYGFSAASAGMLISAMNEDGAAAVAAAETSEGTGDAPADPALPSDPSAGEAPSDPSAGGETPSDPVADDVTAELDGYMALVESLLSDGGFNVTTGASDIDGYQVKKVEEEYRIEGIMIIDGEEYRILGERSYESEPGESENETEFTVYLSQTRRMVVEQSVENEDGEHEREFNYIIYEGRNVIERSTFEYESERGETEIEMRHYKDGVNTVFLFDRETVRGEEVIRIRVGNAQSSEGYIVHINENADGSTYYTYEKLQRGIR